MADDLDALSQAGGEKADEGETQAEKPGVAAPDHDLTETADVEPASDGAEKRNVPLATFLDMRDENKALKAQLAKASKGPDLSKFIAQAPESIPSALDDEAGHSQALRETMDAQLANQRFALSHDYAVRQHGADAVNEAIAAFQKAAERNPHLQAAAAASNNPVAEILDWHSQQQFLGQRDSFAPVMEAGGLEAYEKALRDKIVAELQAEADAQSGQAAPLKPLKATEKPAMPKNFNKGGKGAAANNSFSPVSLEELHGR